MILKLYAMSNFIGIKNIEVIMPTGASLKHHKAHNQTVFVIDLHCVRQLHTVQTVCSTSDSIPISPIILIFTTLFSTFMTSL